MGALYVTDCESRLTLASQHIEVVRDSKTKEGSGLRRKIPLSEIDRVVLAGRTRVSMRLASAFLRQGIPVHLLTAGGRTVGAFAPARDGDVRRRISQYRAVASDWALQVARRLVHAKISNAAHQLRRSHASRDDSLLSSAIARLRKSAGEALIATDPATLRGMEGSATAIYFGVLGRLFPSRMPFSRRTRRPPRDPVNALLSWTYTLLAGEVRGALVAHGLDPCLGVLHAPAHGRPALALDLLEPFRPVPGDRLVRSIVRLRVLGPRHFERGAQDGAVRMTREGMRKFFEQYERALTRPFEYPVGSGRHTTFRALFRQAASDFAARLADGGSYHPFVQGGHASCPG